MDEELEVQWDHKEYEYYVIIPIGKQKLKMAINFYDYSDTTMYGNICIQLYTKRKHKQYEMDNCIMTGLKPIQTVYYSIKAFKLLEDAALRGYNDNYNVILSCGWTNNTRRDAYYAFLSKRGYRFDNLFGEKEYKYIEKHYSPMKTHKFLWTLVTFPRNIESWLCCGWKLHYDKELRHWNYGEYHMMSKLCHRDARITWWDKLRFKWITGYKWEKE